MVWWCTGTSLLQLMVKGAVDGTCLKSITCLKSTIETLENGVQIYSKLTKK